MCTSRRHRLPPAPSRRWLGTGPPLAPAFGRRDQELDPEPKELILGPRIDPRTKLSMTGGGQRHTERVGVRCWGCSMRRRGRGAAVTCGAPNPGVGGRAVEQQPRAGCTGGRGGSCPAANHEESRPGSGGERLKHIHLRDPVDERLLPGRDMATVPRVLGAGELRGKRNREEVRVGKHPRKGQPQHEGIDLSLGVTFMGRTWAASRAHPSSALCQPLTAHKGGDAACTGSCPGSTPGARAFFTARPSRSSPDAHPSVPGQKWVETS